MTSREYQCAMCGGTFETGWSDDAAQLEYEHKFPKAKAAGEARALVCDDCYKQMTKILPPDVSERRYYGE